jgi:enoyl-CoA hydratase/carnithine racemase
VEEYDSLRLRIRVSKGARLTVNKTLSVQKPHAGVVVLQLNRPERLNAINHVMVGELKETLAAVSADTSVHAVVITGAGRGFCSGIDMRDFGPAIPEATAPAIDRLRFQERMAALPRAIRRMPQPVIAAVNGPCVGAGLALCLASDIRMCSTAAIFGNGAGGEPDPGAFGSQSHSDRLPQAAAGARDQSDFAGTGSRHFRSASRCVVA